MSKKEVKKENVNKNAREINEGNRDRDGIMMNVSE